MHTNIHTTVGTATLIGVTAVSNIYIGSACAIASHYFVDMIGEMRFKGEFVYEAIYHMLFLLLGWKLEKVIDYNVMFFKWEIGLFWLFVGGMIAGNLFDIIDKKLGLSIINPKKYPYTYYCHSKRRALVYLTKLGTELFTIINITILTLTLIYHVKL